MTLATDLVKQPEICLSFNEETENEHTVTILVHTEGGGGGSAPVGQTVLRSAPLFRAKVPGAGPHPVRKVDHPETRLLVTRYYVPNNKPAAERSNGRQPSCQSLGIATST